MLDALLQSGRGVLHDPAEADEILSVVERTEKHLLLEAGARNLSGLTPGDVNKLTSHASCMIAEILTTHQDHLAAVDNQRRLLLFEVLASTTVNLCSIQNQVTMMVASHPETQPTGEGEASSRTFDGDVQKLVKRLQSYVPNDPLADLNAKDLGALHHARQISALLQTRALTSRLIPQLSRELSQALGQRYQSLRYDLEGDTDESLAYRLNNATETLQIHSEYLPSMVWKPRKDLQRAMDKLHASLHDDLPGRITRALHSNSALLACGKGPFGDDGRDEWSTLGESSAVCTGIQSLLATSKELKPGGHELQYEPSLDGDSGNNFIATVERMCTRLGSFDPENVKIDAFGKDGMYPQVRKSFEEDESITPDEKAEALGALHYALELSRKNKKQLMVDAVQVARSVVDLQDAALHDCSLWCQESDETKTRFFDKLSKDIESTRVRLHQILKAHQQADDLQTTGDSVTSSAATKKRSKKKKSKSSAGASAQTSTDFRASLTGTPYQDCNTLADFMNVANALQAPVPSLEYDNTDAEAETELVARWIEDVDISEATSQQSTATRNLTASADTTVALGKIKFGDMPSD
jgi:hypothetical protein